jgi:hypothetical protein
LAGDDFSNADCAVIPYILRLELLKLSGMWDRYPAVAGWWARTRARPSVKGAIFDRMTEADWAPFKSLAPDPWPKVRALLLHFGFMRASLRILYNLNDMKAFEKSSPAKYAPPFSESAIHDRSFS